MRRDTHILVKDAVQDNRRVYTLANNRFERNAPLMEQVLSDLLHLTAP